MSSGVVQGIDGRQIRGTPALPYHGRSEAEDDQGREALGDHHRASGELHVAAGQLQTAQGPDQIGQQPRRLQAQMQDQLVEEESKEQQTAQQRGAIAQQQGPAGHRTCARAKPSAHIAGNAVGTAGQLAEQHQGFAHQQHHHKGQGITDPGGGAGSAHRLRDVEHRREREPHRADGLGRHRHRAQTASQQSSALRIAGPGDACQVTHRYTLGAAPCCSSATGSR